MRNFRIYKKLFCLLIVGIWCTSCNERIENPQLIDKDPEIVPDYIGVTIPSTIAPLNFTVTDTFDRMNVLIRDIDGEYIEVQDAKFISIPVRKWHDLLEKNKGKNLEVMLTRPKYALHLLDKNKTFSTTQQG